MSLRLTYHFAKVQGKRSDAFKYAVKSADQAIKRGAMTDGLTSVQNAAKMALTRTEFRVLINVVDRALDELHIKDGNEESNQKLEAYKILKVNLDEGLSLTNTTAPQIPPSPIPALRDVVDPSSNRHIPLELPGGAVVPDEPAQPTIQEAPEPHPEQITESASERIVEEKNRNCCRIS